MKPMLELSQRIRAAITEELEQELRSRQPVSFLFAKLFLFFSKKSKKRITAHLDRCAHPQPSAGAPRPAQRRRKRRILTGDIGWNGDWKQPGRNFSERREGRGMNFAQFMLSYIAKFRVMSLRPHSLREGCSH